MLRALGRLILVPLGLILGFFAAAFVVITLGLEHVTRRLADGSAVPEQLEVIVNLGFGVLGVAAAATVVPALLVVVVGEIARIRSVLYYVAGGGLALASLPLFAQMAGAAAGGLPPARVWTVLATAGFAGGLVYWLIAGRSA